MANVVELEKAVSILLLILLCSPMLSAMHMWMLVAASPTTIHVFPASNLTIQGAINNASSGDVIFVHKGTYYEDIVLNKSVSLIGEDRDLTVIYGSRAQGITYVIFLIASGASVKDFTLRKNSLSLLGSGMLVGSVGNVILHNRIEDSYNGFMIQSSNNNLVSDNIISNNTNGFTLSTSSNNVFSDNVVSDNNVGMDLQSSNNNLFSGNILYNNAMGINLYLSGDNNIFHHNNFNNTVQLSSDSTTSFNVWSRNGEGNYWADYTEQDSNGDGIGDIPYNTDTDDRDNFPLMGPFYDLKVTLKSQTYHVNLVSNSTVSGLRFEFGEETGNRIVLFNVTGEKGTVGFCRIMIPLSLMGLPFIVLSTEGEITPTFLSASNETNVYLYFRWTHSSQTISIVSSETLRLYNELLANYTKLVGDFFGLNATHNILRENFNTLSDSLAELMNRYLALNASYYEHLLDYSRSEENIRNLMYVFAATTAVFLVTTIYLSKRAHTSNKHKTTVFNKKE
jgi:parallel beta-helix repeat protein